MDRTEIAVKRQIAAMGSAVFEVGLYKPDAIGEPVMIPRVWDQESLLRSVPWLRLQNMQGRNVYVRPKGEHDLSLVDDLTATAVQRMKAEGFEPAAVVETSPGNLQAWLKHPKALPAGLSTAVARELAARFGGDPGAADWRHFGRLAGLTNRKTKYAMENGLYPFVRLIESSGRQYTEGGGLVRAVESRWSESEARGQVPGRRRPAGPSPAPIKSIDAFRSNPLYGGDHTRVDLAYAIYALSQGRSEGDVAATIRSRDLGHKGNEKRQQEYVERTLVRAASILAGKSYTR